MRKVISFLLLFSAVPAFATPVETNTTSIASDLNCTDCVDGTELSDAITLDAGLTVTGATTTFSGGVRISSNPFIFGPGGLLPGGVGDSGANAAYLAITRVDNSNMALEFYDATSLRADISVNSSDAVSFNARSANLTISAPSGASLLLQGGGATGAVIDASQRLGVGTTSPSTKMHMSSGVFTLDGTTPGITIRGAANANRVGAAEGLGAGMVPTTNVLVQYSSTSVTGDATIDFTDVGLKDYGTAPLIFLSVLYDNNDDSILACTYHTVATTGFTIECTISTGDGVAQATAGDASARQVNWSAVGLAP